MARYPAQKITILTTYNGQKDLIMDIIEQKCAQNPLFSRPGAVSTVDRYQGQQNDYILLSLVKTYAVGHIRDVRRLIVAMSRARLGLYVFCRRGVFESCHEIQPVFRLLAGDSGEEGLALVFGEKYGDSVDLERKSTKQKKGKAVHGEYVNVQSVEHMGDIVASETRAKIEWLKEQKAKGIEVTFI